MADLSLDLPPQKQQRDLRAVEVLKWDGATDALQKIAAGMPEARLTHAAKAALVQLGVMMPGADLRVLAGVVHSWFGDIGRGEANRCTQPATFLVMTLASTS